ncbi:MAG: FAD-dependent oxidoreductase [Elusimicrobiota bacterium]|jgi:NADPH-dependent glutamate synthase beta subunit-like oxidoreductase/NAD-dependent dihydropyrimidine dehydrogenase PreA subunit
MSRVESHPILAIPPLEKVAFEFDNKPLTARKGEVISSALFSHGIRVFGNHPHDGSPQGIFCANGQCSQCLVIADGRPVKACMERVREGMKVLPLKAHPDLPLLSSADLPMKDIQDLPCDLLVVGGGPAGMGAAIEAADAGLSVILVDDKETLGGKLVLQTHLFFGAVAECYAGTRGVDIAGILAAEVAKRPAIRVMTGAMAVGVFVDGKVGVAEDGTYRLVTPKSLLVAAGAREKALSFPGCDLPGVYGAGAFQTLLNRDLVRPSERLFVVGGGNVGLIAAYHALQAGIGVVGLCEGLPEVGGYWVHADKIRRMGVPLYTSTSVVCANGKDKVESVTVAAVDKDWNIIPGTHRTYACDTLLLAVGLERVCELHDMAKAAGMDCHLAGDAEEIAEASAAMFSGRVTGRRIAALQGKKTDIPKRWEEMTALLKSKPGREDLVIEDPGASSGKKIFPVIGCRETIPCNPCAEICPHGRLAMPHQGDILPRADFSGDCMACGKCVANCPGLAISLVDMTERGGGKARVTLPFELPAKLSPGDPVDLMGWKGEELGKGRVLEVYDRLGRSPCRSACPAEVRAQGYIQLIARKRYAEAYALLRRDLPMPGVCGRVCYHPCEEECVRGKVDEPVAICALKRFVSDWARKMDLPVKKLPVTRPERVAVVGSGPAGLACANELSYRGYGVTVFEAAAKAGGLLRMGIPAYRLPDEVLDYELGLLQGQGITIKTGVRVSSAGELLAEGFSAVFLAPGALKASAAAVPGEDLKGVTGMLDFLAEVKAGTVRKLEGTVAVIGGGNSALDTARAAVRLGAREVRILYRRQREQMPAHDFEVSQAELEGVKFDFLVAPVSFEGEGGRVRRVKLVRMKLGAPDASGRARPVPVPGSEFEFQTDLVIPAIGQQTAFQGLDQGLAVSKWGTLQADPLTQAASAPGMFAGGDAVTGADTVVAAFGAGKRAGVSIDRWLSGRDLAAGRRKDAPASPGVLLDGAVKAPRAKEPELSVEERKGNFKEVVSALDEPGALTEAERCLGCGALGECLSGAHGSAASPILDGARLVVVETERGVAAKVGGLRVQDPALTRPGATVLPPEVDDDVILCRCERVTVGQVRGLIRSGVTDANQLKAALHIGMGACGSKTCGPLLAGLFRKEGVPRGKVTPFVQRPLSAEVPLGLFAGLEASR